MPREYMPSEIEPLVAALGRQIREAKRLAADAQRDAGLKSFHTYRLFRDKVGEFSAVVILVEGRLKHMRDPRAVDLRHHVRQLDTDMLAVLVRASMRFFYILSDGGVLPLGAREIFLSELRSLAGAHEKLSRPEFAETVDASLASDLATAEAILEEIIDKAPRLLQFEDQ